MGKANMKKGTLSMKAPFNLNQCSQVLKGNFYDVGCQKREVTNDL